MKTQVAGAECKVCGRTIVFCADGKSCEACGAVAHLDCEPQAACRACGHVPSAAEKSPISPHRGVVPAEEDWRQTNVTGHARANQSRTDAPPEAPDTDLKTVGAVLEMYVVGLALRGPFGNLETVRAIRGRDSRNSAGSIPRPP